MKITVKLVGALQTDRFKIEELDLPSGARVLSVVESLELPKGLIGIILINGLHSGEQDILKEADFLTILPLLDGG